MPYFLWFAVLVVTLLLIAPLLTFLRRGHRLRRQEIVGYLKPEAIFYYLSQFQQGRAGIDQLLTDARQSYSPAVGQAGAPVAQVAQAGAPVGQVAQAAAAVQVAPAADLESRLRNSFVEIYDEQFGTRRYIFALILLVIVVVILATVVMQSSIYYVLNYVTGASVNQSLIRTAGVSALVYQPFDHMILPKIALAALTGAYLWVGSDILVRYRRRDFVPSDFYWYSLRFAISLPLGYAIALVAKDVAGPFIAFAMGAFPIDAIMRILRRITNRALGMEETGQTSELVRLTPIDNEVAQRFAAEDVTTIQRVASTDPILLAMRTNLPLDFVFECVNPAIAWGYLAEQLNIIRLLGFKGAYEICDFISKYRRPARDADAVVLLPLVAARLNMQPAELLSLFDSIAGEPYAQFLVRAWTGI